MKFISWAVLYSYSNLEKRKNIHIIFHSIDWYLLLANYLLCVLWSLSTYYNETFPLIHQGEEVTITFYSFIHIVSTKCKWMNIVVLENWNKDWCTILSRRLYIISVGHIIYKLFVLIIFIHKLSSKIIFLTIYVDVLLLAYSGSNKIWISRFKP